MTDLTDFITHTFKTIARAVAEAGVNADLFKHPEMISKTLKRRVSAELKRLAVLLRRLIFLMAQQVELAPLVPRPARNYFEKTDGEPKARKAFFSVLPVPAGEAPDFLHGPITVPVSVAAMMAVNGFSTKKLHRAGSSVWCTAAP